MFVSLHDIRLATRLLAVLLFPLSSTSVVAADAVDDAHWAFVQPKRPSVPRLKGDFDVRNPIDRFVIARLKREGLRPSPPAHRNTLIRRAYLDLTGLPPTPADVARFEQDSIRNPQAAFRNLVDRLLASPRFGERIGQNWLDAARYADTTGHAADVPRTMWLYRDWVIDALNSNMPFDQFTIEQLAGDMLPGATDRQKIATGFHRNSMQALGNNPRKEEFRVKGIVDRLETTGRVWIGMTIACAECHDHKYDPISTKEYYRLYAIFNNVPHHGERFGVHGPRIQITHELTGQKITAQVMEEMSQPRQTFVHVRGNFEDPGQRVEPGLPSVLPPLPTGSPANRLTFAKWLVSGDHPLTARVIVNRYWQHYFGIGLVPTSDDFGMRGDPPSHPELLDWLAVEFVESGWDVKALHRLIVTSATYQQSSRASVELIRRDPQNRLLARGARFRLSAEQIRDNALAISGLLVDQVGGPSVFPVQPEGVGQFRDGTAGKWNNSNGAGRYRRGMYTFWQRMSPYPSLILFDAPSRERCCVLRSTTNTPLQALVTLNDPMFVEMASGFASRIMRESAADDVESRLETAFRIALARSPDPDESKRFAEFYNAQRARNGDGEKAELAAWTMVAQVLLNLDETLTRE
jgi:hypothetical protein